MQIIRQEAQNFVNLTIYDVSVTSAVSIASNDLDLAVN